MRRTLVAFSINFVLWKVTQNPTTFLPPFFLFPMKWFSKRFFPRIKNLLFITCWSKKRWLSTRNHFSSVLTESFNRKEKKRGLCIRGLNSWWRVGVGRRWEGRKLMMPKKREREEEEHGNMNCVADNHKLLSFIIRNIFFCSSTNVKFSSSPILLSHSIGNCVKNLTACAKTWTSEKKKKKHKI